MVAKKRGRRLGDVGGLHFDSLIFPKSANGQRLTTYLSSLRKAGAGQARRKLAGFALAGFILERGLEIDDLDCLDGALAELIRAARRGGYEGLGKAGARVEKPSSRPKEASDDIETPGNANSRLVGLRENAYSEGNRVATGSKPVDTGTANREPKTAGDVTSNIGSEGGNVSDKQSESKVKPAGPTLQSMFLFTG